MQPPRSRPGHGRPAWQPPPAVAPAARCSAREAAALPPVRPAAAGPRRWAAAPPRRGPGAARGRAWLGAGSAAPRRRRRRRAPRRPWAARWRQGTAAALPRDRGPRRPRGLWFSGAPAPAGVPSAPSQPAARHRLPWLHKRPVPRVLQDFAVLEMEVWADPAPGPSAWPAFKVGSTFQGVLLPVPPMQHHRFKWCQQQHHLLETSSTAMGGCTWVVICIQLFIPESFIKMLLARNLWLQAACGVQHPPDGHLAAGLSAHHRCPSTADPARPPWKHRYGRRRSEQWMPCSRGERPSCGKPRRRRLRLFRSSFALRWSTGAAELPGAARGPAERAQNARRVVQRL
mmetsp:Transcript_94598/g.291642  ORF Transcript_94598/g.291642 Transcript_94598/m.291642 type:complete len:343 (+) Transcript_94598:914-1942(+)